MLRAKKAYRRFFRRRGYKKRRTFAKSGPKRVKFIKNFFRIKKKVIKAYVDIQIF